MNLRQLDKKHFGRQGPPTPVTKMKGFSVAGNSTVTEHSAHSDLSSHLSFPRPTRPTRSLIEGALRSAAFRGSNPVMSSADEQINLVLRQVSDKFLEGCLERPGLAGRADRKPDEPGSTINRFLP